MTSPLPPLSSSLEKWRLQDWGGLNVSCDSTSTLFLLFLLWLVDEMCFGGKRRLFGECIWNERELSPHLHPPKWGVP